ncbi:MAG: sigma-70 family RNA polymerase sigma factor [Candidatus Marinimicrobia bacterium]|nr:sigma-70 family RNA polymerase sigma factor [Candidatus Neomarinimicrobiota bacterium]
MKSKNKEAWDNLYFVLSRVIKNYLISRGIHGQERENISQDAISLFYVRFPDCEFENYKKLKSYAVAIADNKMKESFRQKKKEQKFSNIDELPIPEKDDQFVQAENEILVKALMKTLKLQERQILYGFFYHGEKLNGIASRLGISEENCRIIKFRSLQKLKKLITVK